MHLPTGVVIFAILPVPQLQGDLHETGFTKYKILC